MAAKIQPDLIQKGKEHTDSHDRSKPANLRHNSLINFSFPSMSTAGYSSRLGFWRAWTKSAFAWTFRRIDTDVSGIKPGAEHHRRDAFFSFEKAREVEFILKIQIYRNLLDRLAAAAEQ